MDTKIDETLKEHNLVKKYSWVTTSMDDKDNSFQKTFLSQFHKETPRRTCEFPNETFIFSDFTYKEEDNFNLPITETSIFEQVDQLRDDIVRLEKKHRELVQEVAVIGAAKAVNVLFNFSYFTMLNLLETNKNLEQILQGSYEDDTQSADLTTDFEKNCQKMFDSRSSKKELALCQISPSVSGASSMILPSETEALTAFSSEPFVDEITGKQIVSTLHLQTKTSTNIREKLYIGSKDAVQLAFKVALTYPENEIIEEQFCGFMHEVAKTCITGCNHILCVDSLSYLNGVFNKHWEYRSEKKKLICEIVSVFFLCSHSDGVIAKLRMDKYIEMLLKTFQTFGFETYDVLCAMTLVKIMQYNGGKDWNCKISRKEIENIMTQGMNKWELGFLDPISFEAKSFSSKLKDIRNESILIQQLSSWLIANATTIHPEKYCALLREVHGVELLEMVLTDIKCDRLVKDMVTMALRNVKKIEDQLNLKKTQEQLVANTPRKEKKGFIRNIFR